ncbi:MAG: YjbQ family protein [Pseudobacteriovorax sp.]|nr:YjbQ family protein [Pseudobacteriovorax sp.]
MEQKLWSETVGTRPKSIQNISSVLEKTVAESGIKNGLLSCFVQHTSASLLIQENADPNVLRDLEAFFSKLVPESGFYHHSDEGPDDMPAHIRSVLTQTSVQIPVVAGKLTLGIWQGVYLWEHRSSPHQRRLQCHMIGTTD